MILKDLFIAFSAGFVGIFAFAPFSLKFLIFISYGYIIYILINNKKRLFLKLFFWGISHWGFGMSWIIVSVYYYGETSIAVASTIYILLTIILSLVFTCPLLLIKYINNKIGNYDQIKQALLVSSLLLISEFSREIFLNGVPWLIPGNVFLDTYAQNIYPILGAAFGSYLIYFITSIVITNTNNKKVSFLFLVIGIVLMFPQKFVQQNGEIPISIIQPSSDPFDKYKPGYYSFIENNLLDLIKKSSTESKMVVIPEAELPYPTNDYRFNSFIEKTKIKDRLVMGAWFIDNNELFNTIYYPKKEILYKKVHLVPFGEYIPFITKLRGLIDFFDLPMSNVIPGPELQENMRLIQDYEVATPICFDIAFPNTVRKMNISSFLIINISNDTWFGDSIGPYHHLSKARIRAIENNKWLIRATNNGFSAIIDNNGTIVDKTKKNITGILEGKVNLIGERSIFNKFGYYLTKILPFLMILVLLINRLCTLRKNLSQS